MADAVDSIVNHIQNTRFQDLPPSAIESAKIFVLDTVGVMVAGTAAVHAQRLRDIARLWGGTGEATIIGMNHRMNATSASMVNAFHAHALEFDCIHEAAVVHPLATIQAALFAACQRGRAISGEDFLTALILGVDTSTAIGIAAQSGLSFFRPATAGIFGTAAACANLMGADKLKLHNALGHAFTQCAGTMQAHDEGKPTLALSMGLAARGGLMAADLAEAGIPAPHQVLEGNYGYFRLMEEGRWDWAAVMLGTEWQINQISHKPYPTGRAAHAGIDAILELRTTHKLLPDQIKEVTLRAPPLINKLVGRPARPDMQPAYAKLCFAFIAATALCKGSVDIHDFRSQLLGDEYLLQLAQRVTVEEDENPSPNALNPQALKISLKNGETHQTVIKHTLGSPENRLSRKAQLAKFRRCWGYGHTPPAADRAEDVIAMIDTLDQVKDMRELIALLGT